MGSEPEGLWDLWVRWSGFKNFVGSSDVLNRQNSDAVGFLSPYTVLYTIGMSELVFSGALSFVLILEYGRPGVYTQQPLILQILENRSLRSKCWVLCRPLSSRICR